MRLFSTSEVARALGMSNRTITKCFDAGMLAGFRIPGSTHRRIPEASIWDFVTKHNLPTEGLIELLRTKNKEGS